MCKKRVPFSIIEKHADECLNKKEKPIIYSLIESDDEMTNSEEKCEEIDDKTGVIDFRNDIPFLIKQCDLKNEEVLINIRRQNAFEDFRKFFGKSWNRKNLNTNYKFSFIGEPAIDIGGVSREFYSGLSIYSFICPVHNFCTLWLYDNCTVNSFSFVEDLAWWIKLNFEPCLSIEFAPLRVKKKQYGVRNSEWVIMLN